MAFLAAWWVHACAESIIGRYSTIAADSKADDTPGAGPTHASWPYGWRVFGGRPRIAAQHTIIVRAHDGSWRMFTTKKKVKTGDVAPPPAGTVHTNPRRWKRAARTVH